MAATINHSGLPGPSDSLPWKFNTGEEFKPRSGNQTIKPESDVYVVPAVRWAFYFFVAVIPFETVELGIPLEVTMIALGLLLLSLVFQLPLCFRKPPLAFGLFVLYMSILSAPYLFIDETYADEAEWQLMVQAQGILICWIAYNVMRSYRVARNALLILGLSCSLVALLQLSGIAESVTYFGPLTKRTTAFGFHPNNIARILSLGLLGLVGLAYGFKRSYIQPRYVVWIGFAIIGTAIVQTGSRGGLLALGAGILVFVLRTGNASAKIRNAFLVLCGLGFFLIVAMQFENTMSRFESAFEDGKLARRELIYPMAWEMFLKKPVFGWGITTAQYELGARLGHVDEDSKNAHNLVLNTLISTGLLGGIPLFAGTLLAVWAAWKARQGSRGILPLAMIATVLVANMSGNWISNKLHWLVVAFALASASVLAVKRKSGRNLKPDPGSSRIAFE